MTDSELQGPATTVGPMPDVKYLLINLWTWIVQHGLTLAALVIVGILIPRAGRLIVRIITARMTRGEEQTKSHLALVGALVYLLEIVAYFFLVYTALTNLGVSTVGAAVPATVISAAIGFGAQRVIGDFLAGFFIISEHQYGVGDFVSFDSTSDQVKGTVVRLTLRSTQIRTGNGELVTVPNSSASVTINYSQEWSRAVVDLEIPMTGDDTMSSLSRTVSEVTRHAIDNSGIKDDVLGEISVLPAMNITPPTAAGLPWTVGIQVTVDVNPATQWEVQRTIRAALVNEFWDRFQAPGERAAAYAGAPTQAFPVVSAPVHTAGSDSTGSDSTGADRAGSDLTGTTGTAHAVESGEPRRTTAPAPTGADTAGTQASHRAHTGAKDAGETTDAGTDTTVETTPAASDVDGLAADVARNGIWRNLDTSSRISRILSVGGRIRPSSGALILTIGLLALIGLFSATPQGGNPAWLAPDRLAPSTRTADPDTGVAPTTQDTGTPDSDGVTTAPSSPTTPQEDTGDSGGSGDTTGNQDGTGTGTGGRTGGQGSGASSPSTPTSIFDRFGGDTGTGGDNGTGGDGGNSTGGGAGGTGGTGQNQEPDSGGTTPDARGDGTTSTTTGATAG